MKKNAGMALVIGLLFLFFVPVTSRAETITLTLTDQNSEFAWGSIHALQPWVKRVERATKGKVKIQIYPNQTLSQGKDNWYAIRDGFADMGICFHRYWPGMTSLADVISLPALPFEKAEKGSEVLWKLYEKYPSIQKQFQDNHILLLYTSNPHTLITTRKRVKTLEDVRGLKIRVGEGPPNDQIIALGGVPMSTSMDEDYVGMQRGILDGTGVSYEAIIRKRLYEVVKYYSEVPFPADYFSIAINKDKWNGLPQDVRDAINRVSGLEGSKFWGRAYFDTAKQGLFEKAGVEINFYSLPGVERARWLEVSGKPVWNKWVSWMRENGHLDAQEILNTTIDMLK
jgi:TRAP-type C4-dicarboxylate transport system substrate-binding protein